MNQFEKVCGCKTEKELFNVWKNKETTELQYSNKKGIHTVRINHKNVFPKFGIKMRTENELPFF